MAHERSPDVVVVGGAAGAAIAHKLAEQGRRVTLLFRDDIPGATDTNQKWLHSGLLYPNYELATKAWRNREDDWKIKKRYLKGPPCACILALNRQTVTDRTKMWEEWQEEGHDVPTAEPLTSADKEYLHKAEINFIGGWTTKDCVIDFPSMVRDLRLDLEGNLPDNNHLPELSEKRHRIVRGARVLKLRKENNRIIGVDFECKGKEETLSCELCVLATGAWSYELLRDIGVHLPLIRKKCLILVVKREMLPLDQIVVCLDVKKEDGTFGDVTLVPFDGKTLAAGTDFKVVYDLGHRRLEDLRWGPSEVEALRAELSQCFTGVRRLKESDYIPRTCFKMEHFHPDHPDVDLKVYTRDGGDKGSGHGVSGLIVALPGKASLSFDLARAVAPIIG